VAADSAGLVDPAMLGVRGNSEAMGLKKILSGDSESARSVRLGLERRGTDLAAARAISLFGGDSRTGDAAEFVVSRDGLLIVAAAGAAMEAGAQDTVTPIRVHIFRSRLRAPNETPLPDPLADPAQDIRVHRATAKAYFVRAGEYIQIIDVDGRQCTDFQCFAARKLDKGLEHPLDVTATRSLVGQNYPLPGLFSKVFDQDTQPLVEVVRDGRAARCLQFRLSRALLRRPGLSRPRQLHGQLWADCERFQESRSLYEW
jgi:aminomethyltransferase